MKRERRFIKVDPTLTRNPKFIGLAADLNEQPHVVLGRLVSLWSWAFEQCPDGDIGELSNRQVGRIMGYRRVPANLLDLLIAAEFVDNGETRCIHDWLEWGGSVYAKRVEDARRKAKERDCHCDVTVTSQGSPRDVLAREELEEELEEEKEQKGARARHDNAAASLFEDERATRPTEAEVKRLYRDDFEEWMKAYGNRREPRKAFALYVHWRQRGVAHERLLKAAKVYVADCQRCSRIPKYPATFLARKEPPWRDWEQSPVDERPGDEVEVKGYRCVRCGRPLEPEDVGDDSKTIVTEDGWAHVDCTRE